MSFDKNFSPMGDFPFESMDKDNNKNLIYLYYFVLGFGNRGNYSQEEIKPKVINWNRNC